MRTKQCWEEEEEEEEERDSVLKRGSRDRERKSEQGRIFSRFMIAFSSLIDGSILLAFTRVR